MPWLCCFSFLFCFVFLPFHGSGKHKGLWWTTLKIAGTSCGHRDHRSLYWGDISWALGPGPISRAHTEHTAQGPCCIVASRAACAPTNTSELLLNSLAAFKSALWRGGSPDSWARKQLSFAVRILCCTSSRAWLSDCAQETIKDRDHKRIDNKSWLSALFTAHAGLREFARPLGWVSCLMQKHWMVFFGIYIFSFLFVFPYPQSPWYRFTLGSDIAGDEHSETEKIKWDNSNLFDLIRGWGIWFLLGGRSPCCCP